ncbi:MULTISPECIES: EcsC family protein [Alteribacter]|uniref:EcsC family protein n=1 Tax=Alteribacter keqinensis TaxID=2483800 RepID=A0A3M7TXM3_9BACI|nr:MULTISPECIES: EcsC family protein [Alteribacter]MBM7096440.1 EcsC family protein [Alteribacter salitolerans]RNA70348.1 EcsC family protein [Alteribacter keqinensis]
MNRSREEQVLEEIKEWELSYFEEVGTDISLTYHKWMNQAYAAVDTRWRGKLLTITDNVLFHVQSAIHQTRYEKQTVEYLLTEARVFNEDIREIRDMKGLSIDQLRFIARKQLAKQRLISLGQGSLTGVGGLLFTLADLPLVLAINLRTVQRIAMTYGYDLRKPYEMMFVLKVFHMVSLPRHLQQEVWYELEKEAKSADEEWLFYDGEEDIVSHAWMQRPLQNITKLFLLIVLRKKVVQGLPIFGIFSGAAFNYQFTKHIAEGAHQFYQKRHLLEKLSTMK